MTNLVKWKYQDYHPPVVEKDASRYSWASEQPKIDELIVTPIHAYMTQKSFDSLSEYSCSIPTGVYEGKMWKAHLADHEDGYKTQAWFLRWYGLSHREKKPGGGYRDMCPTPERRIVIIANPDPLL